jgi:arylsulfatase A-like enzyme
MTSLRRATFWILVIATWLAPTARAWAQEQKPRPNVLFILADDQRFDTIRALGNDEIQTPNLDKLVGRGFAFTNAFCQGGMVAAVCLPSRTMIMTGRSLFRIPGNKAKGTGAGTGAGTLGDVFRRAGFATLFVGKFGNSYIPGNEAFETVIYHGKGKQEGARAQESRFMADQTIAWLQARKGKEPFFVYLGPPVPHDPRVAPPQFHALYDPAKITLPKNFMPEHPFDNGELKVRDEMLAPHPRTPEVMKKHLADYYACITNLDHEIGRIIAHLQATGQFENTIIVFSSDQGLAVGGRHGLMGKQNLYEHFKSPLVIAGPGIPHGQSPALVYLFDLFPTLCELTRVEAPRGLEGSSLAPVLHGEQARVRDWLFCAYRDVQRMVRDERWKLIWYPQIDRYQLFDLAADPWEINDLSASAADAARLADLKVRLAEQQKSFGDRLTKAPR